MSAFDRQMNLVFYDTETTGTDTTFDQILQFTAILTDADLNELDRFETRCRLLPFVILTCAPSSLQLCAESLGLDLWR
ncbi:MAG: exonuclease domain-containing protein [Roseobacter sp.]|uniref:exonuclease domain-containing protein n=1 Tax=Hyphomonas sp. TaxID=87 RepID=UPI0032970EC8